MSRFDTDFQRFAVPALAEQHGEAITYTPRGGPTQEIVALRVDRPPADQTGGTQFPTLELVIAVSRADVPIVRTGADTVTLKRRVDDPEPATLTVLQILSSEGGVWELKLA